MKIAREVKIGLLAVVAIAFMIYGVNYLKGIDLFNKNRNFYVVYDDAAGLVSASPVQYNGIKVGQVTETALFENNKGDIKVLVTFIISDEILYFPDNSIAKLASADLFGTRSIVIIRGDSKEMAVPGDTLRSETAQSLGEIVDAQIAPIKKKAEDLLGSIDTMVTVVSGVLGENSEDLTATIEGLKLSIRNLKEFTDKLNVLMDTETGKISSILSKVESITGNLSKNNTAITGIVNNAQAVSDSLAKGNITSTINNFNDAARNMSELLEKVNNGEGSLGQLVANDSLFNEFLKTNIEINKLLEDMRNNPNKYVHFSIFGRKNK